MVLQDVDTSADSFTDGPNPSDNDTYASTAPSGQRFDPSVLPQPIPLIGPFIGFPQLALRVKTETTLKYAETKIHRPLSAQEAQALAGHLYQAEQTKSYFAAVGAAGGIYRWYTTWAQYAYPFYTPKPDSINPNKFLWVKGPMAQYARHSWRFFCYSFVGAQLGKLVGQIWAQPTAAQATANDPALAQFTADFKSTMSPNPATLPNRTARTSADERRAQWEAAAKARATGNSNANTGSKATFAEDDMSPTAGNEPWLSSSETSWGDSSFSTETKSSTEPSQQSTNSFSRPARRSAPREVDDASPTGGMFQDEVQSQSKPGESAWERLRRGGPPSSANRRQAPHQEQREGSTLGDSFTFVESDDDRRLERERAQREFDARIDRERQGKDFNEERRW